MIFAFVVRFPLEGEVRRIAGDVSVDVQPVLTAVGNLVESVGYLFQVGVVVMDKDGSFFPRPQIVVHLSFGLDDSFKRAESLQMGFSYVGNDPVVRFGYLYQLLDVSRVAGTHFHHGKVVFRAQAKQGEGNTDVIVQISQGIEHVVSLRKYGGHQFLGSSLSVCTRNADDGCTHLPTVVIGKLLQGLQAVFHHDVSCIACGGIGFFIYYGISTSAFQRSGGKGISVERLAFQRNE